MRSSLLPAVLVLSLSAAAGSASADVLFSNPAPQAVGGGFCSPCNHAGPADGYRVWDRFSLAGNATLTGLDVLIHDITPGGARALNVSIWDAPLGAALFDLTVRREDWSEHDAYGIFDTPNPTVSVRLPDWSLAAGSYYLSVYGLEGTAFGWRTTDIPLDRSMQQWDAELGLYINTGRYDNVFTVHGVPVVPEPETYALLGAGLAAVALARRARAA